MPGALGARRPVWKGHPNHVLLAQRLYGEKRNQGGIHSARKPHDCLLEPPPQEDFVLEEAHQPAVDEIQVQVERVAVLPPTSPPDQGKRGGGRGKRGTLCRTIHRRIELDGPTLPSSLLPLP